METEKKIVHKIEEGMNPEDVLCTTYQMRNFYSQFRDGFFTQLDVMNYIQHHSATMFAKKGMNVVDVCCGRSLMLPLLRYYAKDINSYTGVDICEANIREAKRGAANRQLKEEDLEEYYPFKTNWILSNVAEMSNHIEKGFADLVIYTMDDPRYEKVMDIINEMKVENKDNQESNNNKENELEPPKEIEKNNSNELNEQNKEENSDETKDNTILEPIMP